MIFRPRWCLLAIILPASLGRAEPGAVVPSPLFQIGNATPQVSGEILSVAYSPDGKILASAGADSIIRFSDSATGKEIRRWKGHAGWVYSLGFSPDGKMLASGGRDDQVRLWDVATGKEIRTLKGHQERVLSVAFSPDGKTLATGSWEDTVRLWEVSSGKELRCLRGHKEFVKAVAFAPDGSCVASGSSDHTVRLWNARTGEVIRTLAGHEGTVQAVAFAPDGKTLASGGMDSVRLWEVATGSELWKKQDKSGQTWGVSFSPDGKTLASAGYDRAVHLWEIATAGEIKGLAGHRQIINAVAFAPDGRTVASASDDNRVLAWRIFGTQEAGHELAAKEIESLWNELGARDAAEGHRALNRLLESPRQSVAHIQQRLPHPDAELTKRLAGLIRDLDDDDFTVREKASADLEGLGERAESAVGTALAGKEISLEVRRRLERVQAKLSKAASPELRWLRAVQILELVEGPEVKAVLETLVRVSPAACGPDAAGALRRLERRRPASK